uniref:Acyltransferase n=1 Tax=Bradyrhizobium barranii subsp. barranii TaxID=2823807 RepID=A0A939MC11_9BRAD
MTIYRPDIDGLRAVAVFLVLGFHAFPEVVPAGFVGVDIFFVISGFLITGIILANDFSFAGFYARRARRLFPALLLARLIRKSAPEGWRAWCKALMRRRIRLRSHPITFNRERHARHDR